jgi:hypothetical protein
VDQEAMTRYLAGELRIPAADVNRTLSALTEYLETRGNAGDGSVELDAAVRWIVERTMLPRGQVERTLTEMLTLSARLDAALGPEDAE